MHEPIDRAPTQVTACRLYKQSLAIEDRTYAYLMAESELAAGPDKEPKDEDPPQAKISHSNPEEAVQYIYDVTALTNTFMESIRGYNRYAKADTYKYFIFGLSKLRNNLDSTYFQNMNVDIVLDLIVDKYCKAYLEKPGKTNPVEKRQSADAIPTGQDILTCLVDESDMKPLNDASRKTVVTLFMSLQEVHDNLAKVTGSIARLVQIATPDQFSFLMKLAVRPLIQLCIPPNLCSPTELK